MALTVRATGECVGVVARNQSIVASSVRRSLACSFWRGGARYRRRCAGSILSGPASRFRSPRRGGGPTADAYLLIDAPLTEGSVEDTDTPHLALVIDVGRLRVVDLERSDAERETMRARLIGPEGLDAERFSRITYHSLTIDQPGAGIWLVQGELEMYGRFLPLDVRAVRHGDRFTGATTLSPAEFGLSSMPVAGVLESVAAEVRVDFDIVLEAR